MDASNGDKVVVNLGDKIEVTVEKLSFGGSGVARHNSLVVFVPFSAPGDHIQVQITEIKKNFVEAKILKILAPGSSRRKPPCPVAGTCGGCDWQHVEYAEQLNQKHLFLKDYFSRFAKLKSVEIPKPAATDEFAYRNRIQLKVQDGKIGFFSRGSHELVEVDECLIADASINEALREFKKNHKKEGSPKGQFERVELSLQKDRTVTQTVLGEGSRELGFSQVNEKQNQVLIAEALRIARQLQPQSLFDLYCGKGNFSFPLMELFPKLALTGVDLGQAEIAQARSQNSRKNVRFLLSDVGSFLKRAEINHESLVVLDPPRSGCDKNVCDSLNLLRPQNIIYISCNPTSFARDIERLTHYKVKSLLPVDMFPQTSHIELVAHLTLC